MQINKICIDMTNMSYICVVCKCILMCVNR